MTHTLSADDRAFREDFESGRIAPAAFNHLAHVRLVYCYLAEHDTEESVTRMRTALHAFLERNGIEPGKYHETLTRAWTLAVRHFMARTGTSPSSDEFIARNPVLLDNKIMLTHYSAEVLFSPEARAQFVEPDISAIPRHD